MLEKTIEEKMRRDVARRGGLFIKIGVGGLPDRMVIAPGPVVAFAELKTERGRLSKLQRYWLRLLGSYGLKAEEVRGEEEARRFVAEVFGDEVHAP